MGPISLVVLAILGISKLWPIPPNQMNSFDQMAEATLLAGGFGGMFLYTWNVVLLKLSANPVKRESLTVSAAVFGVIYGSLYVVLFVLELAFASRPHSQFVALILIASTGQFLTIMSWLIPKVLVAARSINRRMGHL